MKNHNMLMEFFVFIKENKSWWLIPIIIMLALVLLLIIFGQASPAGPFVYALF